MNKIFIVAILILASCLAASVMECNEMRNQYSNAMHTIKAYDAQLDST